MSKRKARLHPVVEAFVRTDKTLGEILAGAAEPAEPIVKATLGLLQARDKGASEKEARALAESVETSGVDTDLLTLFYVVWSSLSLQQERVAEASSLLKRARLLVNERTPAEIRATLMTYEAHLFFYTGRKEQARALFGDALTVVPKRAPRYPMFFLGWAELLAALGCGAEVEAEYARLVANSEGPLKDILAKGHRMFCLCHYGETGQVEKAIPYADPNPDPAKAPSENFAFWGWFIAALQGRAPQNLPNFAAVARELLAGRAEQALQYARKDAQIESGFLYGNRFDAFNMVRAELANSQADAARRLIRLRREIGNKHYLDDFFLARAELLSGNREEAARRFAAAYDACKHYQAEKRLEIELRLACEMSRADVMFLMAAAARPAPPSARPAKEEPPVPASMASGTGRLVGASPATGELRRTVEQIAPLDAPVLITGETGTGKELVARAIHEAGPRSEEPFLAVNCGAIAENLLESELFGHERGAFTGAAAAHRGLFEEAGRGALLLDEIGEMSSRLQVVLLRVLEAGEIRPVGSARSRKIACRVIAATNADLEARAEAGTFRKDLLYRLKRLEIRTRPLRERREDILPLAGHFLSEGRAEGSRPRLSADLQAELKRQAWPGNVRELRNRMEQMRLMNSDRLEYGLAEFEIDRPAPASASVLLGDDHVQSASKGCSRRGRIELIRGLFRRHRQLTRKEIIQALGVAQGTATTYLRMLCREGFIEKVTPSGAPHTHYFKARPEGGEPVAR